MPLTCTYGASQGLSFVLGPPWALSAEVRPATRTLPRTFGEEGTVEDRQRCEETAGLDRAGFKIVVSGMRQRLAESAADAPPMPQAPVGRSPCSRRAGRSVVHVTVAAARTSWRGEFRKRA